MKVKTITCHKVYNYGATLQEYALLKAIEDLGFEAETISYTPNYLSQHFNLWKVSNPKYERNIFLKIAYLLVKLPERLKLLKRKKSFDIFEEKHIKSSKTIYKSNEELKANLPEADAYICGSDQIWNSFFQNGKDPAFYLDFVPEDKLKISYAASFAIDSLEESIKPFVKEKVKRIDKISVRESSALKILEDLNILNGKQVLDPVFLLSAKYWIDNFVTSIKEKFIFVYDCDSNSSIQKIVIETARKNNLKIFTVNQNIEYADKNFCLQGPNTFLSLINSAEYVISNSFHAVAFSLLFEKTFFVVDRNESINTRMRDIMSYVNLSHLHLKIDEYKSFDDVVVDYKEVKEKLEIKTQESKLFLKESLQC